MREFEGFLRQVKLDIYSLLISNLTIKMQQKKKQLFVNEIYTPILEKKKSYLPMKDWYSNFLTPLD